MEVTVTPIQRAETRGMKPSVVWTYFSKGPGGKSAQCLFCGHNFRFVGTSNLLKHLRRRHPGEALPNDTASQEMMSQVKISSSFTGFSSSSLPTSASSMNQSSPYASVVTDQKRNILTGRFQKASSQTNGNHSDSLAIPQKGSYSLNSERRKLLDQKVAAMIAKDLEPVSIVENKGFLDLLRAADPQYSLPSQEKIETELLPNLYGTVSAFVKRQLEGIDNIALSTDLWSNGNQADNFTISAHFISPSDWTFQSLNLSTAIFYTGYSGDTVTNEIERSVAQWDITNKIRMMITDSATNVLLANQTLQWGIIPCLANLLHLVVTDALIEDPDVTSLIARIQDFEDIVCFYQNNTDALGKLSAMQKSMNIAEDKLVKGVNTRWNSIFHMFERVLEQIDAINAVFNLCGMEEMCLSTLDAEMMKSTLTSLKPFEIVAKTLSSNKDTNIGAAIPLVEGMQKMMASASMKNSKEPLATSLKSGLSKRFEQMWNSDWIIAATLLDPRFKKFPFTNKELTEKAKETIVTETAEIMGINRNGSKTDAAWTVTVSSTDASDNDDEALWMYFDSASQSGQDINSKAMPTSAPYREVHRYLDSPPIPRKECPLLYWKQHQELYPSLSQLALRYMGVPATSLSSDRLLSTEGEAMMEKKSRLEPKTIDTVLFLHKNLRQ